MFFDDRLAMPGVYGGSVPSGLPRCAAGQAGPWGGARVLAQATRRSSRATYSTTTTPFHVARTFATWTTVRVGRPGTCHIGQRQRAQNFGVDTHLGHDERYDRAENSWMCRRALDTWEDGAILHDRTGVSTPTRPGARAGHVGQFFSRVATDRATHPQDGRSSSRPGLRAGARIRLPLGRIIFTEIPDLRSHAATTPTRKNASPMRDAILLRPHLPMAYAVVGESEAHAKEREAYSQ